MMYIDEYPLLHVVDEAARFQATLWLTNLNSSSFWNELRVCWIDSYLKPPDSINLDARTNFTSSEIQQYSISLGIEKKEIPVESANLMSIIGRYHKLLRRVYSIIKEETKNTDKNLNLQIAIKAINHTAGPNMIIPTLPVFGAYPRMSRLVPRTEYCYQSEDSTKSYGKSINFQPKLELLLIRSIYITTKVGDDCIILFESSYKIVFLADSWIFL